MPSPQLSFLLKRDDFSPKGVFGMLSNLEETFECYTLEHAYGDPNSSDWLPVIPPGVYKCERGLHKLDGMIKPFTTYEITDVKGHSGLLFHAGNTENDSHGCVLLGLERKDDMILHSRAAFTAFMNVLEGVEHFELRVE